MRSLFVILFAVGSLFSFAQQPVDILHYKYQLEVSDGTDVINGIATIDFKVLEPIGEFYLDLTQRGNNNKGMMVTSVTGDSAGVFRQENNKLFIALKNAKANQLLSIQISYSGIPSDGLIISKNKYGDRTFFADNWPNRAHNWIPCIDVPVDKATFEFLVTAPAYYQVVSNGSKVEERMLDNNKRITHWKEDVALPTKVMVIGVARFATKIFTDSPDGIPVSAWVYPKDSSRGFYDYSVATGIVKFFSDYIAPFPYNKLANVQSKTIFGGMENASAIFYAEQSVTGTRQWEDVMAHEIAHQWYGDMASEKNFSHLWLSEGFATYMTDIYIEHKYGKDSAVRRLQKERNDVRGFVHKNNHPVVDTTSNLMSLLNENSYQKGSWVLHMLRNELGDSAFHQIIRTYYQQYKGSNADSRDFELVAEKISGRDLKWFFDQWLYQGGIPRLDVKWQFRDGKLFLKIQQRSQNLYTALPLKIEIKLNNNKTIVRTLTISQGVQEFDLPLEGQPSKIVLDPDTHLLFEGKVTEEK